MGFRRSFEDDKSKNNSKGDDNRRVYYGTTNDAYDIRWQDDCHQTYGKQYTTSEEDD